MLRFSGLVFLLFASLASAQTDPLLVEAGSVGIADIDFDAYLDAAFQDDGVIEPSLKGNLVHASAEFEKLPAPVQALFGSQTIALDVTRADGVVEHLGVTLKNNQIQSVTRYPPKNPTMRVETDEETVMNIALSSDKAGAFLRAVNTKALTYKGLNSSGETAAFAAGIFTWIALVIKSFMHFVGFG